MHALIFTEEYPPLSDHGVTKHYVAVLRGNTPDCFGSSIGTANEEAFLGVLQRLRGAGIELRSARPLSALWPYRDLTEAGFGRVRVRTAVYVPPFEDE